ncbi:MAG: FtsX-like permease family protein, partial [Clostridia bacterium]|nr:FtsX-like permease family protein [Clostridia bacterium]
QLKDALLQIQDGREEIAHGLAQIQEGETQIRDGIAEAEQKISEGEDELNARRIEVENGWAEAQAEFANGKEELQKAADELAEWEGYQALSNQFLLRFSADASPSAVLQAAKAALQDANVLSSYLFQDSPVKQRIDDNLIPMGTMANFIPIVFFGITMIVVYLFMALMIRQCRREIGILRALGFTRFRVISLFCGVGFAVSIGAVALGLVLSLGVQRYLCAYFYDLFFHLPIRYYVFNTQRFLLSAVLTVAAVLLSTLVGASSISSIQPSEAMTRPQPATVRIPRLIQWMLRGASPFFKFSIISLLRNKLRFLFSAFCLSGSVMMVFTSFSLISSSNEIIHQVFDRCIHYDCQVFIRAGAGDDLRGQLAALPYVSDVEAMDYYAAEISFQGNTEKTTVAAVREQTELVTVEDQNKKPVPIQGNGVILEKHLAEQLGADTNDIIIVNGVSLPVAAVSQQNGSRFQYVTLTTAQALSNQSLHSLVFRIPLEKENDLMQFLMGQEDALYTSFTRSAYSAYETILSGAKIVSLVLIFLAMAIGMVIVVNTSQTNLLEQKKELCVLRTLGFQHSAVSRYWFCQSILHFLVSCVFGFPAGIELTKYTLRQLEMTDRAYTFVNNPMDYAMTAVFVFCAIILSHLLTMRALKGWDIVEVVKEKE